MDLQSLGKYAGSLDSIYIFCFTYSFNFDRKFKDGLYEYSLVGIVSGSLYCGSKFPDFYTYVAHEKV